MRYRVLSGGIMAAVLCLWPLRAQSVTRDTFLVQTTRDLVELCTAKEDDPLYTAAVNFCHGYLVGAYQYQVAAQSGPGVTPLFCMSNPAPTRQEGIRMFVSWVQENTQYGGDRPVDSIMRFLATKWPCAKR